MEPADPITPTFSSEEVGQSPDLPPLAEVVDGRYAVVIADDDAAVRAALSELCDGHPNLRVVGTATNGVSAGALCIRYHPHLAVVDVMMPQGGVEVVATILAVSPRTVVAAYTARGDRRTRERVLASGAAAVFVKGGDLDLVGALHALARRSSGDGC